MAEERKFRGRSGGGRRFFSRPKFCQFCSDKEQKIDYKNVELLKRLISDDGKIRPRRQTGTCAKHQRELARAIKKSRSIALLPYVGTLDT